MMIDKHDILAKVSPTTPVAIELGCGNLKREPGSIGVDILDSPVVDIVGDVLEVLSHFPDQSVTAISSFHVFEHLPDVKAVLSEVQRVLVPGGRMVVVVPHFSNPFFYSDPTHRNFFGLYTFCYYCRSTRFRRTIPTYVELSELELVDLKLVFKSFPPRYLMHAIRKLHQLVFNLTPWFQEIYEDSFSRIFSCYEIRYVIERQLR